MSIRCTAPSLPSFACSFHFLTPCMKMFVSLTWDPTTPLGPLVIVPPALTVLLAVCCSDSGSRCNQKQAKTERDWKANGKPLWTSLLFLLAQRRGELSSKAQVSSNAPPLSRKAKTA